MDTTLRQRCFRIVTVLVIICISSASLASESLPNQGHSHKDIPYATHDQSSPALTSLDLYIPAGNDGFPVFIFLHGGTWVLGDKKGGESKVRMINNAGWILASVNYRLSPDVMHPTHAYDVANAIAWISEHISDYQGDPDRIVIMGHSAGAHLAALIATDARYLEKFGKTPGDIKGIIGLDSGAYFLPELFRSEPENIEVFTMAFGDQSKLWNDASPVTHVKQSKLTPPFLLIYAGKREISKQSTFALAAALRDTQTTVQLYHAADKDHVSVERSVGQLEDKTTDVILDFLQQYK